MNPSNRRIDREGMIARVRDKTGASRQRAIGALDATGWTSLDAAVTHVRAVARDRAHR